jgi:type 1 fimbriae regulatory protein FimB/type 1 fimbriae regulatory protein FimE
MGQTSFSAKLLPAKPKNTERRTREHLSCDEVAQLMRAARQLGRHRHRNATLILLMYRHGLRVSVMRRLRWESIDLKAALLHVRRLKRGGPSSHPLHGPELRALRQLKRIHPGCASVFLSERGSPLSDRTIRHIMLWAGEDAGLPFPVHPPMLRHACGCSLANKGMDTRAIQHYLGHRNRQYTVRYTELAPHRFLDFWDD